MTKSRKHCCKWVRKSIYEGKLSNIKYLPFFLIFTCISVWSDNNMQTFCNCMYQNVPVCRESLITKTQKVSFDIVLFIRLWLMDLANIFAKAVGFPWRLFFCLYKKGCFQSCLSILKIWNSDLETPGRFNVTDIQCYSLINQQVHSIV